MLNCEAATVDMFARALWSALRSDEDLALVDDFVASHDTPWGLTRPSKRMRTKSEQFNPDGASAVEDMVTILILGSDVGTHIDGIGTAFEFLEEHPECYKSFVVKLFKKQCSQRAIVEHPWRHPSRAYCPDEAGYCIKFMNCGVRLHVEGKLSVDDLAAFFEATTMASASANTQVPLLRAVNATRYLAVAFQQVDVVAQLKIWAVLEKLPDSDLAKLVGSDVIERLVTEVRLLLVERAMSFQPAILRQWLTARAVLALGKAMATRFLAQAHTLAPEAKAALCAVTKPDLADGGF